METVVGRLRRYYRLTNGGREAVAAGGLRVLAIESLSLLAAGLRARAGLAALELRRAPWRAALDALTLPLATALLLVWRFGFVPRYDHWPLGEDAERPDPAAPDGPARPAGPRADAPSRRSRRWGIHSQALRVPWVSGGEDPAQKGAPSDSD